MIYLLDNLKLEKENKKLKQKLAGYDYLKGENKHMKRVLNEKEELKKELKNYKPVTFNDKDKGTIILYEKEELEND